MSQLNLNIIVDEEANESVDSDVTTAKLREQISTSKTQTVNPVFARHETFHPRFGWLTRGFDQAVRDPEVFLCEDATVRLGVGKNMVKSIRYWCKAFKILEDQNRIEPSYLGNRLFGAGKWDRFLEDPASLWWLHWHLLKQDCYATAWDFTFNHFRAVEFTVDDLFYALCEYRDRHGWRIADSSIRKDVTCILRMYVKQPLVASLSEDSIDCPFTELGLIHTAGDSRSYTWRIGTKRNLPAEILVAACLDYVGQERNSPGTIAISRLLFEPGSPGMAFKLSESAISQAIEQVAHINSAISISDNAGLIQFSFTGVPLELQEGILSKYYSNSLR